MTQIIIATILAGGNREALIGAAIDSVIGFVDEILLVNTGPSAEVAVAQEFARNSGKVRTVRYPFGVFDCATARNFAIDSAAGRGATWVVMLDTDERLVVPEDVDVRAALAETDAECVMVFADAHGDDYAKARFLRVPSPTFARYEDPVHEDYRSPGSIVFMNRVKFVEVPKSADERKASAERVARIAREWLAREPQSARAWMHLGCALSSLGDTAEAARAFYRCAEHTKRPEEEAWASFREGGCRSDLGAHDIALDCAVHALALTPYIPEPAFLAAWATMRADRPYDALAWADMAIALGSMATMPRATPTTGAYRVAAAWWEGPWLVRAYALNALGLIDLRDHAIAMHEKARELRGAPMADAEKLELRARFDEDEAEGA